jgi:hypothetical protein
MYSQRSSWWAEISAPRHALLPLVSLESGQILAMGTLARSPPPLPILPPLPAGAGYVRPGAGGTATTAARCGLARLGAGGGQGGRSRGRLVSRGGRDSTERPAEGGRGRRRAPGRVPWQCRMRPRLDAVGKEEKKKKGGENK